MDLTIFNKLLGIPKPANRTSCVFDPWKGNILSMINAFIRLPFLVEEGKMEGVFRDCLAEKDWLRVRRFFLTKREQSFSFVRNKNYFTFNLKNKYPKH